MQVKRARTESKIDTLRGGKPLVRFGYKRASEWASGRERRASGREPAEWLKWQPSQARACIGTAPHVQLALELPFGPQNRGARIGPAGGRPSERARMQAELFARPPMGGVLLWSNVKGERICCKRALG